METSPGVVANLVLAASAAAGALREVWRALAGSVAGFASRQSQLLTVLSQSVTLFVLGLMVGYLRDRRTSRSRRGASGAAA